MRGHAIRYDTIVIGVGTARPGLAACLSEAHLSPTEQDVASDEVLDAWLLSHVTSSGTCKMGPASDPMSEGTTARSS